ncbi:PAS domain-containing protein [Methylobacterium terricola]|uniref:Blue-light-activated histidine kinase n=1 Tax=Methylobacterium terricola TaxID=2583531 RepID=A0A5C4LKD3_9HYPH|nr:PAS domain-containing protein [Methylobacterium terricola]TNC13509.1 PAS domain-containing protein [Methylobacterium terricola]
MTARAADAPQAASFLAAFQASEAPMVMTDPHRADNPIVFANPAFCRLTGYAPDEVVGRNCRFLQGPDTDPAAVARVREAVALGEPLQIDILNYRKDGHPFWNSMTLTPVRDEDGTLRSYFAVLTDVTRARQAERALAREKDGLAQDIEARNRALQSALDQQTALLHEVDHRVKNNLQVISSLVLLKARRARDAACRDVLRSMADRIGALATVHRLLYSLSDVARFDLRDFADDFAAELEAGIDPDRIALTVDVAAVAVPASMAAPLALLVHELSVNAVRHAFPGERHGRVAITARVHDERLILEVRDDGVGLNPQSDNPEGFGRDLVGMLVRQLRGSLAFEDLNPGTRAHVVLPLGPGLAGAGP